MTKRSIQASPVGVRQAKRAFALTGWTQENLAGEVNLKTRQPIWRFFTEQPVDRHIFIEICTILNLNWRDIALNPPVEFSERGKLPEPPIALDVKDLLQQLKSPNWDRIQNQFGILQQLEQSLSESNGSPFSPAIDNSTNRLWHEVLLLTVTLYGTDTLVQLLKQQIDELVDLLSQTASRSRSGSPSVLEVGKPKI